MSSWFRRSVQTVVWGIGHFWLVALPAALLAYCAFVFKDILIDDRLLSEDAVEKALTWGAIIGGMLGAPFGIFRGLSSVPQPGSVADILCSKKGAVLILAAIAMPVLLGTWVSLWVTGVITFLTLCSLFGSGYWIAARPNIESHELADQLNQRSADLIFFLLMTGLTISAVYFAIDWITPFRGVIDHVFHEPPPRPRSPDSP